MSKVILVTGASKGIGASCAAKLALRGYHVYGASRSFHGDVKNMAAPHISCIPLDVKDSESVKECVNYIIKKEGRLDVIVNAAGVGIAAATEEVTIDEVKNVFETNVFGAMRVCQFGLPEMRKTGEGLIINISSIAGRMAIPYQSHYCSSKFALEGYSEALDIELSSTSIKVVIIEPGNFRTDFTRNRIVKHPSGQKGEQFARVLKVIESDETNGSNPDFVAEKVTSIVNRSHLRLRYSVGPPLERAALTLSALLPSRLMRRILRIYYKMG